MHPSQLSIKEFTYELPEERIAVKPPEERDASKLLIYKNGNITEDVYKNIAAHLPEKTLLVFNNTKVIQARLQFQKPTGGAIEIFCLEPMETINEYATIMATTKSLRWKCLVGGAGKWKQGLLTKEIIVNDETWTLSANMIDKLPDAYLIELSWQPEHLSFSEVIDKMGDTPLPPYIKRKAEETDKERYQTIYAKQDGSVAAPTAGLHFTPGIFTSLKEKNIQQAYVTLHVGAGTFKPVKAEQMAGHLMHAEWMDVTIETIETLKQHHATSIIAVGTTAMRTLESLYWMGIKSFINPNIHLNDITITQWEVYEAPLANQQLSVDEALSALLDWMKKNGLSQLIVQTQILIAPGYTYRLPIALVTNFHQPQSTLLLLVAAAIGNDWKAVYEYALDHAFRFLSYGDGNLLFINRAIA